MKSPVRIKPIPILTKETDRYVIALMNNVEQSRYEIHLRGKSAGKHFAVYTHYNLLDDRGNVISNNLMTPGVGKFLIENFEYRGDTESFHIYEADLSKKKIGSKHNMSMDPSLVRHKLTTEEDSFTATGKKLGYHWPVFKKYAETGYGSIIRATMTNHQVCASHCHYCSTILRNKKDSVSLDEAKTFVEKLYFQQADFNRQHFQKYNDLYKKVTGTDVRLKGLILSGGGQPNLWPHFSGFVKWLGGLDIDLGLITNGFPKHIDEEIYTYFKWIRISVTPEDASPHYKNGQFNQQYFPKTILHNPDMTVGLSYVYGPWTDDGILKRIHSAIIDHGMDYCRLLTDCNLTRNAQLLAHHDLAEKLFRLGYTDEQGQPLAKIFHQLKYHGTPTEARELWQDGQCYLQTYNVFWDTTGHDENGFSYCYPCDSVTVLAEERSDGNVDVSERKFNAQKWGTVRSNEVEKLFAEKVKAFFDPREICSACLFMRNNRCARNLIEQRQYAPAENDLSFFHVNFP